MACSAKHARKLYELYAAAISQRLISHWLKKHVWTDWQFQVFEQWSDIPIQLHIMKSSP
jgi:hypothetical protein